MTSNRELLNANDRSQDPRRWALVQQRDDEIDGVAAMTIRLPAILHEELRQTAFRRRLSMNMLVTDAVATWLRELNREA